MFKGLESSAVSDRIGFGHPAECESWEERTMNDD